MVELILGGKMKVLVSDYDQTFYINDNDIEKNKKAVEQFQNKGNIFVIATGRSYLDFKNKLDLYNFNYDYVILNHGATILDKDNNIFANYSIDSNIIKDIYEDLNIKESINSFNCSELESRVDFNHQNLTKINVKYNSREEAMRINKIIKDKYSNYVVSYFVNTNSIEIISNQTNKSNAINILIERLGLSKDDIYTIGDGYSDIDMIKDFNGYAIKDSVEELKQVSIKEYESVSDLINDML